MQRKIEGSDTMEAKSGAAPADGIEFPQRLAERIEVAGAPGPREKGEYVLYWAHHALRAHENPALEVAAHVARELGVPLLVYQGLGGRHRYNSDRHHRFILESARDFAAELDARGQRLLFHLPTDPLAPGPLGGLLDRCALAVSELYPVPPFTDWHRRHREARPDLPFWLVDASCTLPLPGNRRCYTRAFQFRNAFMDELLRRARQPWPVPPAWPKAFTGDPGFEPFDLAAPLDAAIAGCLVDHSVPAVADTPGGSRAGYDRWEGFRDGRLGDYHAKRNDAALPDAVSRMSPYLHYGCVSPFRIAREAVAMDGEGPRKFLDELLTWRELNHHFCHHAETLETLGAIPDWARESLAEHELDPRDVLLDWERLARGRSGDPLWDLAQRSLLRRGELHNNLRMTWGKAFLPWTRSANRALKLMIDLNHRYALDGNDPNSYGGLLWCLGQFDRAFPPGPVFGKVRQRSARAHARRLDVNRYARNVSRPAGGRRVKVAVVGAGMAGLTAARILEDQGHEVTLLEKARGPGGRMSTRREGDLCFDHGAQYFTVRDPRFLRHVVAWRERGLVAEWTGRVLERGEETRFVGVPGMSAVCSDIARGLADCHFGWRLATARFENGAWRLESDAGTVLEAEELLLTAPPEQARELLPFAAVETALSGVSMLPCWAVMAELDRPLAEDWDGAFVNQGPLGWVSNSASRPARPDRELWVLHATPDWSLEHLDSGPEEVCAALLTAARDLPRAAAFEVESVRAHRWRYARAAEPLERGAIRIHEMNLTLAGDWCHGSRVEGAFLSGAAAAGRIMASAHGAALENPQKERT
jgi:photolyase PhrII